MFDLDAPIIPGKSAGGFYIGQPIDKISAIKKPIKVKQLEPKFNKLYFDSFTIFEENGYITDIFVHKNYKGKVEGKIGIGSTLLEVQETLGPLIENEPDDLIAKNYPGLCFNTGLWRIKDGESFGTINNNLDKKIEWICVYEKDPDEYDRAKKSTVTRIKIGKS